MKLAFIAVCILLAVSVNASFRKPVTSTQTQGKKAFDFYVFATEWTGSVCSTNSCTKEYDAGVAMNFWNIHGLWPSDGHMSVNYCSDEKFDPSQINSLKNDLAAYWSGLYSSADSFHGHEWEKHGTCSGMTQSDYFSTVMKLAKDLDVYGALQRHNILPGTQTYTCAQISNAIQQSFGVTNFALQATSGYITQLSLCITKDLKVENCPTQQKICSGTVKYPALKL
jgi:ribonuclease T2